MVQYNNEPVIQSILLSSTTTQDSNQTTAPSHRALSPEPVLVTRLPSSSELDSLGRQRAKQAQRQHILHDALTVALDTPLDAHPVPAPLPSNTTTITAAQQLINKQTGHSGRPGAGGKYESHDVWRAIEQVSSADRSREPGTSISKLNLAARTERSHDIVRHQI